MIFGAIKNFFANFSGNSLKIIKTMWGKYLFPQKWFIIFAMILMIVASSLEALSVKILEPIFNEVFIAKNKEILTIISLQVVAIFGIKGIANYLSQVMMSRVGMKFVKKLQVDLFKHLMTLDISFFQHKNSGELLAYFIGDVNMAKDAILNSVTALVKNLFTVLFLVILLFYKSFEMAVVTFVIFPMAFWPLIYFGKKVRNATTKQQMNNGGLYATLNQTFRSMKVIKSYCIEGAETRKIDRNIEAMQDVEYKIVKIRSLLSPLMEFFGGIAIGATLSYGGWRIINGLMTTGDFMVFLMAIVAAYKPLKNLATLNVSLQMGIAALNRIFSIFNTKPVIKDLKNAIDLDVKTGKIVIKDVSFGYEKDIEILHNINMVIEPNKTTAIVGFSGSGKSTLINLLLRYYDVNSGSIKIDGQDLREVKVESLRKNIALVSQDVVLFDDTIKENIKFGEENISDERIKEVAKLAAADDFINNQPNGYDTIVGEMGKNLSGGQKQMISIARAMLKNAPILLLDEATSSLDSKSESQVQNSLEKLMEGRTTVVIAHRLSTIINAHKIYVFSEGKIVEEGNHKELIKLNGFYAKLYNLQYNNYHNQDNN